MKLDPSEITKVFEELGREGLDAAKAFENRWTAKGVPAKPRMRMALGFAAVRLMKAGCSRELLFEYLDAALDEYEKIAGKL